MDIKCPYCKSDFDFQFNNMWQEGTPFTLLCPDCKKEHKVNTFTKIVSDPRIKCPKCGIDFVVRVNKRERFRKSVKGESAVSTKPMLSINEQGTYKGYLWDISQEGVCIHLPLLSFPSLIIKPGINFYLLFYIPSNEKPIITSGSLRWVHKDVALERARLGFHLGTLEEFQKRIIANFLWG